jgi:hypothetical protein
VLESVRMAKGKVVEVHLLHTHWRVMDSADLKMTTNENHILVSLPRKRIFDKDERFITETLLPCTTCGIKTFDPPAESQNIVVHPISLVDPDERAVDIVCTLQGRHTFASRGAACAQQFHVLKAVDVRLPLVPKEPKQTTMF